MKDIDHAVHLAVQAARQGLKANFLKLLDLVHAGIPMPFKAVSNKRSFIGLKNLVDAVCLCLCHEGAANQTVVVSDNEDLSTSQLIAIVADGMNRPLRLFSVPERLMKTGLSFLRQKTIYDHLWGKLVVDSSGIQNRLGWNPPVSGKEGIEETVGWYLKNQRQSTRPKA